MEFRKISSEEFEFLRDSIKNTFNLQNFEEIVAPFNIIIVLGKWKEILLISDQLLRIFQEFKKVRAPYFMGIYFGDISRNKFKISLEGITFLSKYLDKQTILNDSGEKKVLYGRDLSKKDVKSIPYPLKKYEMSVLVNVHEEVIALGKYLYSGEIIREMDSTQKIIKNVIDKGWYLRKGQ